MRKMGMLFGLVCFLLSTSLAYSQANTNKIIGVKTLPLPDERVRVIFQFEKTLKQKPMSFTMKDPAKLIFDFVHAGKNMPDDMLNKVINVGVLRKYALATSTSRLRAILDLKKMVSYVTDVSGSQFNVTLMGKSGQQRFSGARSFYSNRNVRTRFKVQDIDFRGANKNSGQLVIKVSSSNVGIDVQERSKNIVVKLKNTRIPSKYLRRLDVRDFHTPAQDINAYQKGKNAEFVIRNKGSFGQFAYQVNDKFYIEVFPLTSEEVKKAKLKKEVFTGKRISLNFQNIGVRAVLQLIADFTGENIVVSDSVGGNITLRLSQVPWDQALNIILKTRGLSKRKLGDVLLIAPAQEIAAREKAELAAIEQSKELAPLLFDLMQINYAKASDIAAILKGEGSTMLSNRGSLSVDERTNSIWVQETAVKLGQIKDLVKKLDIPVKQVLIESRVVTVRNNFEQELGIRFGVTRPSSLSGTLEGANTVKTSGAEATPVANRLNFDLAASAIGGRNPASVGIALARLGRNVLLDLELSALEAENKAEIVASPRLITANQKEAVIQSGEEIPYLEASSSGAATVAFKKAVLSLRVTPQITPDNNIILELKVNKDEDTTERVNGVPVIATKQIDTTVLVKNGQTIVLGGIYSLDKSKAVYRVPFLGAMPIVGNLFRTKKDVMNREEILIFITPKIIKHSFMTS